MAAVVMALLGGTAGATEIALAVRGVQLERLGQSRRVRIALTRAPDGIRDYRLDAPPRLVIELDGPASRTPVPTTRFPLADDVVTEVRASPHDGRLWAVLALGPATGAHVVRREGDTLVADQAKPPAVVPSPWPPPWRPRSAARADRTRQSVTCASSRRAADGA
jgi:hypothetical protein